MLKCMGIDGRRMLLLLEDYQLADDTLLSYPEQLVITGDVIKQVQAGRAADAHQGAALRAAGGRPTQE